MRVFTPLVLIAMLTSISTALYAEDNGGQLKRARDEVRPKPSTPPPGPSRPPVDNRNHDHSYPHQHYQDTGAGWTLFGWFGLDSSTSSTPGDSGPQGLLAYPYADDQRGWLISGLDAPADPLAPASVTVRGFGGAVRGEYTDGGDGLQRYAAAGQLSFTFLRVETEWHRYIEHLPGDTTDTLTIGTVGIALALPLENSFTLLIGGGVSTYHDTIGNESGWYLKAGAEMFPIRPLILNAEVWGGYIREDSYDLETFMGGGRATAGVIWNRFEVFGGWQALWIESVTLDGPTVGMRVWF